MKRKIRGRWNEEVQTMSLWHNNCFKIENEVFFFKKWYECNIIYVRDSLNDDGSFKTLHKLSLDHSSYSSNVYF